MKIIAAGAVTAGGKQLAKIFWIILWCIVFVLGKLIEIENFFMCKGVDILNGEYYRFVTGLFFHRSILHLGINCYGLFWVVRFLKRYIQMKYIVLISFLGGTTTNIFFAYLYPDSMSYGGSPIVYTLIGTILVWGISKQGVFEIGTWYGNSILIYAVLACMPLFSQNISTLIIHIIAFVMGVILSIPLSLSLKCGRECNESK